MPRVAEQRERGLRTCAACRQKFPRAELLRFVIDGEGRAWLDRHLKAPGRGAHLCYQRACVEKAVKRKSLSASFKQAVSLPELDHLLKELVGAQLSKISDLISLAQRKRVIVTGLNNLEASRATLRGVIYASDIAEGSHERLLSRVAPRDASSKEETDEVNDETSSVSASLGLDRFMSQAPFLSRAARDWCLADPEWTVWYRSLIEEWSSVHLGHLTGRAPRVALGFTEAEFNLRLNSEIRRISQVLVASLPR